MEKPEFKYATEKTTATGVVKGSVELNIPGAEKPVKFIVKKTIITNIGTDKGKVEYEQEDV